MNDDEYTPGPWHIWVEREGRGFKVGQSSNLTVASLWHPPLGTARGNARLVAAAPQMFEALKGLLGAGNELTTESKIAVMEAIDAAEGKYS